MDIGRLYNTTKETVLRGRELNIPIEDESKILSRVHSGEGPSEGVKRKDVRKWMDPVPGEKT